MREKKVREDREVSSHVGNNEGMGKDYWCVAGDDGACLVIKAGGEGKGDGDKTAKIIDGLLGFEKGNGEKEGGKGGLKRGRGVNNI